MNIRCFKNKIHFFYVKVNYFLPSTKILSIFNYKIPFYFIILLNYLKIFLIFKYYLLIKRGFFLSHFYLLDKFYSIIIIIIYFNVINSKIHLI